MNPLLLDDIVVFFNTLSTAKNEEEVQNASYKNFVKTTSSSKRYSSPHASSSAYCCHTASSLDHSANEKSKSVYSTLPQSPHVL